MPSPGFVLGLSKRNARPTCVRVRGTSTGNRGLHPGPAGGRCRRIVAAGFHRPPRSPRLDGWRYRASHFGGVLHGPGACEYPQTAPAARPKSKPRTRWRNRSPFAQGPRAARLRALRRPAGGGCARASPRIAAWAGSGDGPRQDAPEPERLVNGAQMAPPMRGAPNGRAGRRRATAVVGKLREENARTGRRTAPRRARKAGGQTAGLASDSIRGSARLGSARLGSARLGSARLGSARLGSARLGSARLLIIPFATPSDASACRRLRSAAP